MIQYNVYYIVVFQYLGHSVGFPSVSISNTMQQKDKNANGTLIAVTSEELSDVYQKNPCSFVYIKQT